MAKAKYPATAPETPDKPKKAAPTLTIPDELEQRARLLRQDALDHYSKRNNMMREMRERRYQERKVSIPKAFQSTTREVRLPILTDTVDLMVAICDGAKPKVQVDPYDTSITAKRNSNLRERWSEAMLDQAESDLRRKFRTMARENQISDGLGVLKVTFRGDTWQDVPDSIGLFGKHTDELSVEESADLGKQQDLAKRGARLPFSIVDVDPMTFFPGYGPDGDLDYAIEIQERQVRAVLADYAGKLSIKKGAKDEYDLVRLGEGVSFDDKMFTSRSTVQVWEYWDRHCSATFVSNVCVKYAVHDTGRVPYFHCYARPSSSRDPERRSRPPLYKTNWLLDLLDSFWTMMSNAGFLYSYPTPVTYTPPNTEVPLAHDGKPQSVKFEAGRHMVLYQGQELKWVAPPADHLNMMAQIISQALHIFEASSGLGPAVKGLTGSDASGYQVNQLIQASMLSLQPALEAYDWMLADVIAYTWRLIERRIQDRVWVMGTNPDPDEKIQKWLSLEPDDVKGYYRCRVVSRPLVDQARRANGAFGADMLKAGLLPKKRILEDLMGYENEADDILDELEVEKIMASAPFSDMITFQAIKRAGIPLSPKYLQMLEGNGPGTGPPVGAPPLPMPNMPTPGGAGPGVGPTAPGVGTPLNPAVPPAPPVTGNQMQGQGLAARGRPAGEERQAPNILPRPIQ